MLTRTLTRRLPALAAPARPGRRALSCSAAWRQQKAAQPQTPATESIELTAPATYISHSHDPWFNLSYEDWLMRHTPVSQPVLFIYRNAPCVVIGRNQNPWMETTPRALRERAVPLVRRRSGGGTVYHDMGNTNFSIILPRLLFTRAHGAELVARAIRERLGVPTSVNARNDVVVRDGARELKVSGSAYKIIQHRAYHHGTMLISSELAELGQALRSSSPNIETKSVASHRSPVTTLNHYAPGPRPITHDGFAAAVCAEFARVYGQPGAETIEIAEGDVADAKVWAGVAELKLNVQSWEWQYGQTPEFTNTIIGELSCGRITATMTARHAKLSSLALALDGADARGEAQAHLDALALALVGRRYESLDGAEGIDWPADAARRALAGEVVRWLRASM